LLRRTGKEGLVNRLSVWAPAAAWASVLFLLSAVPDLRAGFGIPYGDKFGHLALYGVLGVALAWGRNRAPGVIPHVLLLALGALYGISDEFHQMYVPGRQPDFVDWIADVVGLSIGYGTTLAVLGRLQYAKEVKESLQ
jgi:VanZ family protein